MSEKRIAIVQSNYIPWKGYFDLIASVDEFILYDDMQYTRRDWRNRNKIKTSQGIQWLTVPVHVKGKYDQKIYETRIQGDIWQLEHWRAFAQNYKRAKYFSEVSALIRPIYLEKSYSLLADLNQDLIRVICKYLDIKTIISSSRNYKLLSAGRTERLANLCLQSGAAEYVSGPSAKNYIESEEFKHLNIKLTWFDYGNYAIYPQLWGEFSHAVSILDLLFNCGKDSCRYMNSIRP